MASVVIIIEEEGESNKLGKNKTNNRGGSEGVEIKEQMNNNKQYLQ